MPQFRILFYANYTILVTQRGGMVPCPFPLNTPLEVAISSIENIVVVALK